MSVKLAPKGPLHEEMDNVRKYCITKSPGFAGIALYPEYYIIDAKDEKYGKEYGFTDGRGIYLGTRLFREAAKAQAYVLLHEIMHVALRHPQRGFELRIKLLKRGIPWSHTLFNWAVDCIVNHALDKIGWIQSPSIKLIKFDNVVDKDVMGKNPPHTWSSEKLYMQLLDQMKSEAKKHGIDLDDMQSNQEGLADAIEKWMSRTSKNTLKEAMMDIELPLQAGAVRPDTSEESRNWEQRLKRAAAGDRAGGVMREILFDVPVTKTPWQQILRMYLSDAVMPITHVQPSRPSRQNITAQAYSNANLGGNPVPFMPGYKPKPGIRKLVVVVDTSGSIDDELCEHFAGEIQAVRANTGCDLTLITCDADVHQIIDIPSFGSLVQEIRNAGGFKGRGGTNFVPGVEAAEKVMGAAMIIYLTDMQGPYPTRCRLPLIWASTTLKTQHAPPPVGRVIELTMDL